MRNPEEVISKTQSPILNIGYTSTLNPSRRVMTEFSL